MCRYLVIFLKFLLQKVQSNLGVKFISVFFIFCYYQTKKFLEGEGVVVSLKMVKNNRQYEERGARNNT